MSISGWDVNKKIRLVFNSSLVDEDLTDFVVPVKLCPDQRPASVDDDFTGVNGDVPNELLWKVTSVDDASSITIAINSLKLAVEDSILGDVNACSLFLLSGDFDVQVDILDLNFSTNRMLFDFICSNQESSEDAVYVRLNYESTLDVDVWSHSPGGWVDEYRGNGEGGYPCKFRIVRTAVSVTCYYFYSGNWHDLTTIAFVSADMHVQFRLRSLTAVQNSNITIDNFKVNSGTVVWPDSIPGGSGASNFDTSAIFDELQGNDEYTKLLIHSDTTDESTQFIDSSASVHIITANGIAHHEVDQKKFGSTSIYFDGDSDYLTIPDSDDWIFGSDDFTIDFWVYTDSLTEHIPFCGQIVDNTNRWQTVWNNTGILQFYSTISSSVSASYDWPWTPTVSTWHHIAYVRDGIILLCIVDGIVLTPTIHTPISSNSLNDLSVVCSVGRGRLGGSWHYAIAYMDEIRISKGIARWTDDFTPLSHPYGSNKQIAFEYENTGVQCFGEIVSWDYENQRAHIDIKVPFISSSMDTYIHLYYDSTHADNDYIQPPLSIDDDFTGDDGDAPNELLWEIDNQSCVNGTCEILNNKIRVIVPISAADEYVNVLNNRFIVGDFDIQVDYDEISNDQPSSSASYPARIIIYMSSGEIVAVGTMFDSGDRRMWCVSTLDASFTSTNFYSAGKLRIIRSSGEFTVYYWSGSQWEWDGNTSGKTLLGTDDSSMYASCTVRADFDSGAITDFDNFQVNSGTILPRLEDNFTGENGDAPRTDLWKVDNNSASGTVVINSNKLRLSIPSTPADEYIITNSAFSLSGDFDIQVDYDEISNDPPSSSFSYPVKMLLVFSDMATLFVAVQLRTGTKNFYAGSTFATEGNYETVISSGKLRLIRINGTITAYVWDNAQWEWDGNTSGYVFDTTKDLDLILSIGVLSDFDSGATTDLDNFIINYAESITGYIGDTNSVPSDVVHSDRVFISHQAKDPTGSILDSSPNAMHGTSYGTMLAEDSVDGLVGKAIEYDGTDDYTNHGYNAAHDITDLLTIRAVIRPSITLDSGIGHAIGLLGRFHDPTGAEDTYQVYFSGTGRMGLHTSGGDIMSTKQSWIADEIFVLTATYNSTGLVGDLYVDGVKEVLDLDNLDTMTGSTNNLVIGKSADTGEFFPGSIDEVLIINAVMSDAWVKADNAALRDNLITFTIGSYKFSGYVTVENIPEERTVLMFNRSTYLLEASTLSNSETGYFELTTATSGIYFVNILPELTDNYNILVYDKIELKE